MNVRSATFKVEAQLIDTPPQWEATIFVDVRGHVVRGRGSAPLFLDALSAAEADAAATIQAIRDRIDQP